MCKQSVAKKMKEMIWRENIKVKRKEKKIMGSLSFPSFPILLSKNQIPI